jgi:transcriptional regulator with XRE-family HTH domain
MIEWVESGPPTDKRPVDYLVVQETALAMAQATIQNALTKSGLKRSELAEKMGRPRSFISRMLRGSHNLTIKTFALALAACGFEPSFGYLELQWGFMAEKPVAATCESASPTAGGQFHGNAPCVAMELLAIGAMAP